MSKFKVNNLEFNSIREVLDYYESSQAIFVDIKTDTTPNEILGFEFKLKSWRFPPIEVGYFLTREEGYLASLESINNLYK